MIRYQIEPIFSIYTVNANWFFIPTFFTKRFSPKSFPFLCYARKNVKKN